MNTAESTKLICDYLNNQRLLTLCCSSSEDVWCANCFYYFDQESMSFILMSDAKARHGLLMQANPKVVGTVSDQTEDLTKIQGIQFSGSIKPLIGEREQSSRHAYYQSFPISKVIPMPLWRLTLETIKMLDNTQEFGKNIHWVRNA